MSIYEVLNGSKPLFRSTTLKRFAAEIEEEFTDLLNSPFQHHAGKVAPVASGSYDDLAAQRDYQRAKRGGELQSIRQLIINCAAAGEAVGSPFNLGEFTGILLAPRTSDAMGHETEASDTARIYVEINNSGVWIPMSFNLASQGSQKGDAQFIAGPIASFRVVIQNPSQDPTNQPNLFLWLVRGVTVVGQFGAAVGYGPPSQSGAQQSQSQPTTVTVQSQPPTTSTGGGTGGAGGGGGVQKFSV